MAVSADPDYFCEIGNKEKKEVNCWDWNAAKAIPFTLSTNMSRSLIRCQDVIFEKHGASVLHSSLEMTKVSYKR